jgi:hypothetical protein
MLPDDLAAWLDRTRLHLLGSHMTTHARLWALLMGLTLLVAACGDDDNHTHNTPTPDMAAPDMGPDMTESDMVDPTDMMPDLPPLDMAMPDMELPGDEIRPSAFAVLPPVPVSCDMPSERYRLPFIIATEAFRPARIGDKIAGRALIPNKTVTLGSVVTRRTRIAATTPLHCASDADCTEGFLCAGAGIAGAARQCVRSTSINFVPDTVRVDFDPGRGPGSKDQVISLLIDNSGGLLGYLPKEDGELYGEDGQKDLLRNQARASDARLLHRSAMKDFITFLAGAVEADRSRFSVWRFGGSTQQDTVPLNPTPGLRDTFTQDLTLPVPLIDQIPEPAGRLGTSNVYQGILRVVTQDLGLEKYKNNEKFLFVFVDGPNEVWDSEATQAKVQEALVANKIHLFIIHFDPQLDTSTIRDPLAYWAGNLQCRMNANTCQKAPTCASDAACQNHERCRAAKLYPTESNGTVTETAQKYCMPERRDGRFGPIQAYSELACATGGNYFYITQQEQLATLVKVLPYVIDGQWSIEADISSLDLSQGAKRGFYYLSGVFLGLFGNASIGDTLSAPVPDLVDPMLFSPENRPVIRVGKLNGED